MNSKKVNIVLGLIILGLVSLGYSTISQSDEKIETSKSIIQKLEQRSDSLLTINRELDLQVKSYLVRIDGIKAEIKLKDLKINQLKKDVEESIANVDTAGYDDLVRFFTDRYDQSFSTYSDSTSNN